MKPRSSFKDNLKWHTTDLYKTEEDFNQEYIRLEKLLANYSKYSNHILDNANTLYELLDFDTKFNRDLEQLFIYAHLKNDEDTTNTKNQALFNKTYLLYQKYIETTSFIAPEILKSEFSLIEKYLKEKPELQEYARMLKDSFKLKKYTLSEKEEYILSNMAGSINTPSNVFDYLTDADLKFGKIKNEDGSLVELTEKNYREFIESSNRNIRKKAFKTLFNTYGNFKNTYAALLLDEFKNSNKLALIRGFSSARAASLYNNDIPEVIYDNLIKTVKENIVPLEKFWTLKKKALNLKQLHLYDTNTPLIKQVNKKYTIEEAKDLILAALNVLGNDYITNLKKAFNEGWIDYPSNDGKRNGAYCTACYNVHPYVLLSFDGSLNNVSTLAHELGHAMHYYYAIKNQNFQDYGYSIFVAEVASQVNQILLSKYLINNTSNLDIKKYLIDDLISDFKATIYRQTMFAEFEYLIHIKLQNQEPLTHEDLEAIYYKLNQEYYGKNVVIDDEIKYEWARIPHFYMNFYVYQYATAYAAAIKIAMDILNNKPESVNNYLKFLSLGCTIDPIASLKVAGVDMMQSDTLNEAFRYFNDLINELEELIK